MPEWIFQLGSLMLTAGAIYGGIRADIRSIHECANEAKRTAGRAHERIDELLIKTQSVP